MAGIKMTSVRAWNNYPPSSVCRTEGSNKKIDDEPRLSRVCMRGFYQNSVYERSGVSLYRFTGKFSQFQRANRKIYRSIRSYVDAPWCAHRACMSSHNIHTYMYVCCVRQSNRYIGAQVRVDAKPHLAFILRNGMVRPGRGFDVPFIAHRRSLQQRAAQDVAAEKMRKREKAKERRSKIKFTAGLLVLTATLL